MMEKDLEQLIADSGIAKTPANKLRQALAKQNQKPPAGTSRPSGHGAPSESFVDVPSM